ncbi:ABC transporter permease [Halostella sp. PRR32]|uniref:ABC transporter permease n=1 Tax=Halostella sp. PRR32 TaxID=3098147 RepID=UPI002B1D1619|nr:ABC transporter permease [Halostella sp. PRR32]
MINEKYYQSASRARRIVWDFFKPVFEDRWGKFALTILVVYVLIGIVGPHLPMPGPFEYLQKPSGEYAQLESPSAAYPFGTTYLGYSVLSQTIHSFRTSLLVGFLSAALVVTIGVNIGLVSGYYGGKVDTLLMGLTDLAYGLPFYPLAIILVAIFGSGLYTIAVVIALLFWRSVARITRSETLSLREREFVKSAKAAGSSDVKIMYYHLLPNLLPLILIYFVFAITWGILLEASLSFIGLGNSDTVSWGLMLHQVFESGELTRAWWWVVIPSFALWLFIWSLYVVARSLEDNVAVSAKGGA